MGNPKLELARRIIENTGASLFLTGRAGTGKTTFLHDLRASTRKRVVVAAPTGIAAIRQADAECGSCGCALDAMYKRALELL